MVECLPSILKFLGSIPVPHKLQIEYIGKNTDRYF